MEPDFLVVLNLLPFKGNCRAFIFNLSQSFAINYEWSFPNEAGPHGSKVKHALTDARHFLFLQGPHGPFFYELSRLLQAAGHKVCRIGINRGDRHYWPDRATYEAYLGEMDDWETHLSDYLDRHSITDVVVYGDTRPIHDTAKALARARGIRIHCFEEGYLRPYWITYERDGANGNSRLMDLSMAEISALIDQPDAAQPEAPAQWGAIWRHIFYGSIYHANILFRNASYPNFKSHRAEGVFQEWMLHCKRLLVHPFGLIQRRWSTAQLMRLGAPYHVALLQLGHDASVQDHSPMRSMEEFIDATVAGFAVGAPGHHQLVFKAHPLEDGREPVQQLVEAAASDHGISDRVWFIQGGKLGPLLDRASSAITVNSTAGQQALWRGLPLKAFGRAVYSRPEFVSDQPLADFFAKPTMPDQGAYRLYRQFLLETSQVGGGYYSADGRRIAKRRVVDLMLSDCDIYDIDGRKKVTPAAKLSVVSG